MEPGPGLIPLIPDDRDRAWGMCVTAVGQGRTPSGAPVTGWRLYYMVRGAAVLHVPQRGRQPVESGDALLLDASPGVTCRPDHRRGCLAHQIDFSGMQMERHAADGFFAPLPTVIRAGFDEHLLSLVAQIIELARMRPPGTGRLVAGVLANLLARLEVVHRLGSSADRQRRLVQEARMMLVDPTHDRYALQTLAGELGVGYSWFRRSFRDQTGVAPHQFRLNQRLVRAQQLLADTALPVARIASELGFSSQAYFARLFRRKTGLSPTVWRRNQPTASRS